MRYQDAGLQSTISDNLRQRAILNSRQAVARPISCN